MEYNLYKTYVVLSSLLILGVIENIFIFYHATINYWQQIRANYALALVNTLLINFVFVTVLHYITTSNLYAERTILYALYFLLLDLLMYLWHRAMHTLPVAWRFHQVHHSELYMNTSSSFRFHFVEILASKTAVLMWIWLWRIPLVAYLIYEMVFMMIVLYQHSNISVPYAIDKMMSYVIVTPNFHRVHHSQNIEESQANYSSVFSVWDHIFRTFMWRKNPNRIKIGLSEYPTTQNFIQLLKMPFNKGKSTEKISQ